MRKPGKDREELWQYFVQWASSIGMKLSPVDIASLDTYTEELLSWNKRLNLTGSDDRIEVLEKHLFDSISILPEMPASNFSLLDIGTGAGLPGIVIRIILSSCQLTLMEIKEKRVDFLRHLVYILNLKGVEIIRSRAEVAGYYNHLRGKFDRVVCRAVAPLRVVLEYALPFVKLGGFFIAQQGGEWYQDREKVVNAAQKLGGKLTREKEIILPVCKRKREVLLFHKYRSTPLIYPRRVGLPRKRPL